MQEKLPGQIVSWTATFICVCYTIRSSVYMPPHCLYACSIASACGLPARQSRANDLDASDFVGT